MKLGSGIARVVVLLAAAAAGMAQVQGPPPLAPAQQAPAPVLSPQQLDDLVAPIALYPDPLLGQVLAASTYPLEVVEAQQWLQKSGGLTGTVLMDAARQQNWDASVQALVAFPQVLSELNQDIRWTTDLGNAFLAQQADVMSAVQRMRASAQARGRLNSSAQQTVTTQTQGGQTAIAIQPANPQVIYVPNYDPAYIWGPPVYGYYPPLAYPAFGFGFWPGFDVGLFFGGWGGWGGGWGAWGWGPNWFGRGLFVNSLFFNNFGFRSSFGFAGRGAWFHDPIHRLGVAYPTRGLSQRFGGISRASAARMSSRFGPSGAGAYNRSAYRSSQISPRQFGSRSGMQGSQSFRGAAPRSFQSSPRYSAPAQRFGGSSRSFSGSAPRSFSGGGGSRSFSAPRSFGGGSRSFGGGGGSRSFGGGGHSSGGHSGGGHSGGGHGRR